MNNYTLDSLKTLVDSNILKYIPENDIYSDLLYQSEEYSVKNGGKRLRPLLLLSTVILCGGKIDEALPFACSMEFIHTYSLIHDDLPAMDNDDFRRGLPSNHKKFGEDTAILAGDGLLTAAFNILADQLTIKSSKEYANAFKTISEGAYNMVRGQIADVYCSKKADEELVKYIHKNKTGQLIKASVIAGAYISGASKETLNDLDTFSESYGRAFQIADDILDFNTEEPCNYADLFGLEHAKNKFEQEMSIAENILKKYNSNDLLFMLCSQLRNSING